MRPIHKGPFHKKEEELVNDEALADVKIEAVSVDEEAGQWMILWMFFVMHISGSGSTVMFKLPRD